jgi:fluoroquinolone transport system ATP-binding protein
MIEVTDLRYTYPGNRDETITGIDFSITDGEIFGFLGPSGAGKSTTQRIMIGLLGGYQGSVTVDGAPLGTLGKGYYEKIGVSFELPNLFSKLTARENLKFFTSLYTGPGEDPDYLLERVGLGEKADVLVGDFSKGMKMRLNVARSLVNKPKILFLDEPTSGLDPANARRMKEIITEKKREGVTIFLTTHNMTVADELCDRVAFITDGSISVTDSPRELKVRYGKRSVRVEYSSGKGTEAREFPLDSIGSNDEFIELLQSGRTETIHSQEATLEDIFIEVTGRSLSETDGDGEMRLPRGGSA